MKSYSLAVAAMLCGIVTAAGAAPEPELSIMFHKDRVEISSGMDGGSVCISGQSPDGLSVQVFAKHDARFIPVITAATTALREGRDLIRASNDEFRVLVVKMKRGEVAFAIRAPADKSERAQFPVPRGALLKVLSESDGLMAPCYK